MTTPSRICPRGCGQTVLTNAYGELICFQCARTFGEFPGRAEQAIPDSNAALHAARAWEGVPSPEEEARESSEDYQFRMGAKKRFADVRKMGYSIPTAAEQAGVSSRTGSRWSKAENGHAR